MSLALFDALTQRNSALLGPSILDYAQEQSVGIVVNDTIHVYHGYSRRILTGIRPEVAALVNASQIHMLARRASAIR